MVTRSELESLRGAGTDPGVAVGVEEPAQLFFTSGTTGRSKACLFDHRYAVRQAELFIEGWRIRAADVLYNPFPLFHIDASVLTLAPAIVRGCTAAIGERFSAGRFWDEVRGFEATVFDYMGATLNMLWKQPERPDDRDNPVRLAWGVPLPDFASGFVSHLLTGRIGGYVPAEFPWMLGIAVVLWFVLNRSRFGAHVYLVGDNDQSARMMGVRTDRVRMTAFALVGVAAAFAGIASTLEANYFWPTVGSGAMLPTVATVFLGGTSIFGGRGTVFGTVVAAFVIGVLGLLANPVKGVNGDGTTTLQGTFEPYQCNAARCDGYVQAGARSVFVQFPASCNPPARGTQITVTARPARDLGNGSYRATRCA